MNKRGENNQRRDETRDARRLALEGLLREAGRVPQTGADERFVARVMRATDRAMPSMAGRRRWPLPLALAAGLLAAAGLWLWTVRERPAWPLGPPLATVTEALGTIQALAPDGTRTTVHAGQKLFAGQRLETETGGQLSFAFIADPAEIVLGESSVLSMASPARLRLERGELAASVGARQAGIPFSVDTPNARAEVLGTRFRMNVHGEAESRESEQWQVNRDTETGNGKQDARLSAVHAEHPDPSINHQPSTINHSPNHQPSTIPATINHQPLTILHVDDGRVRFTRLADEAAIEFSAGHFAVVGDDLVLKPYPQGTEWIEGRVIFEDDFEKGLKHWTLLQSRVDEDGSGRYEPFTAEAGRAIEPATVRHPQQHRPAPGVLLKVGDASQRTAPLIVLNTAVVAPAYSVEWICRFDLQEAPNSSGGPHSLKMTAGEVVRSRSDDVSTRQDHLWRTLREEVTPLGPDARPYAWEIRALHDGKETSVLRANFSQESIAFRVSKGNVFILRCTVRELVPVATRQRGNP